MHTGEQGSKCRWEVGRDWSWSCLWTMLCWAKLLQSCLPPWDPMDCCPSGSSVQGFLQARILEWVAMFPYRWSSQRRVRICAAYISCTGRQVLYHSHHQGNPAYGLGGGTWIGYNNDIIKNYKKCVQSAARKLHVCAMCFKVAYFWYFCNHFSLRYGTASSAQTTPEHHSCMVTLPSFIHVLKFIELWVQKSTLLNVNLKHKQNKFKTILTHKNKCWAPHCVCEKQSLLHWDKTHALKKKKTKQFIGLPWWSSG